MEFMRPSKFACIASLSVVALACAQSPDADKEPAAILELGGASAWDLRSGSASFGADIAAEATPIENWLELEAGTTPLFTRHSIEWDTDLLFKKPWTLSKKAEFMLGLGPEWVHLRQFGVSHNAFAAELALDFMFWPTAKHHFGYYVEPSYDYTFAPGHERSIGVTAGLLIAIP
jgi:hypothetical protein